MLRKQINRLIKRYGCWRLVHITFAAACIILASVFVLELIIPVRLWPDMTDAYPSTNVITTTWLSEVLEPKSKNFQELANIIRPRLFKAATPLRDKPMADKTIERIRSQLKLQCIMEINGEQVAYISIKGIGLKKCKVGDCVNDLFTVLNITKKSVETTIIGHKVTLSL